MAPVLPCGSHSALPQVFCPDRFAGPAVWSGANRPSRGAFARTSIAGPDATRPETWGSSRLRREEVRLIHASCDCSRGCAAERLQNGTYLVLSLVKLPRAVRMVSGSQTQPPHVPPVACWMRCPNTARECATLVSVTVKDHGPMAPAISPAPKTLFAPAERPLSLSKSAVLVCFHTHGS